MDTKHHIPTFPTTRPLELTDKPLLDPIFGDLQPRVSELTFAGLYLFRNAHSYHITMAGDSVTILGKGYDGGALFLPPLTGDIQSALRLLFGSGLQLYGADEPFADRYLADDRILLIEDRDAFDYLYLRSELAELAGRRYHKKKNRVNYFTLRHSHSIELFDDRYAEGCRDLLGEWERVRADDSNRSVASEVESNVEAISMADTLGLEGVVVLVEGRVKAFALGERLSTTTSVCHFEKSDPFMEGISQLVEREFNRLLFTDCIWVNREQDLGEPGLRGAKLSYHPVELVKKFRAGWKVQ